MIEGENAFIMNARPSLLFVVALIGGIFLSTAGGQGKDRPPEGPGGPGGREHTKTEA
jgi:hypothetical protein